MIEIERVGFCDEVRPRADDKLDMIGYNTGRKIVLAKVPTAFTSMILVQGFIEGETEETHIAVFLERENAAGEKFELEIAQLKSPPIEAGGMPLTMTCPLTIQIFRFGTMRVRVVLDGEDADTTLFSVVQNKAPSS